MFLKTEPSWLGDSFDYLRPKSENLASLCNVITVFTWSQTDAGRFSRYETQLYLDHYCFKGLFEEVCYQTLSKRVFD